MTDFGLSFSLHRCSEFGIDKKKTLRASLEDLGVRRFRLMGYWNIHEAAQGHYDFSELDWQMEMVAKYGGQVSLCLGARQPRWPEFHIPDWALQMPAEQWHNALCKYIEKVVKRYSKHPALLSWQLENEALLKSFGDNRVGDFDRQRLKSEFALVKNLDPNHPIIMTTSDSWGLPFFGPKPDIYGMSVYRLALDSKGNLEYSKDPAIKLKLRRLLIRVIKFRALFIHELQAEPWVNQDIATTTVQYQLDQMGPEQLKANFDFALSTGMNPIDVWGLEWWYWLKHSHSQPLVWNTIKRLLNQ